MPEIGIEPRPSRARVGGMEATAVIWHRGRLVPWQDATVHVLAHALHYGSSIFEGIRAYDTPAHGTVIFRLGAHLRRLFDSARIYRMEMPHDEPTLRAACWDVLRENGLAAPHAPGRPPRRCAPPAHEHLV